MPLIIWSSTELLVCIICASIPVLRPFYKKVRGAVSSSAQYELDDTTSRPQGSHPNGTAKNSYLTHSVSQRLSGPFGNQPDSAASLRGLSANIMMAGEHENFSDDDIMLRDTRSCPELGVGGGVQTTTAAEISYK